RLGGARLGATLSGEPCCLPPELGSHSPLRLGRPRAKSSVRWIVASGLGAEPCGDPRTGRKAAESETGIRVTMLGAPGTRIYVGAGPLVDGPPHHRLDGHAEPSCPLVLVRRKAKATTYAAVHEPYAHGHTADQGSCWTSKRSFRGQFGARGWNSGGHRNP